MDRRTFVSGAIGLAALTPQAAGASTGPAAFDDPPVLRGTIDANHRGLVPDSPHDQSRLLQSLLREAAAENRPLALPPGRYVVADIVLPAKTRILGIAGASILAFAGGSHLLAAENAEVVDLRGLVLDGCGLPLADHVPALVHLASVAHATIDDCTIRGSSRAGLGLDRSAGRVERTTVAAAAEAGIRTIESAGLTLSANTVAECGAGIIVWRWRAGEDGTMVTGNRIERIGTGVPATGEPGDGISVFRAHGVMIAGNRIAGCSGAAIRAVEADGIQATGNACRGAGEGPIVIADGVADAMVADNAVRRDAAAEPVKVVKSE